MPWTSRTSGAAVWTALDVPMPRLARDAYTADQLVEELTGPGTGVRTVAVHKHRVRYVVDGCTSELTDVTVDGRPTRTIAVETEDAAAVSAIVRRMRSYSSSRVSGLR